MLKRRVRVGQRERDRVCDREVGLRLEKDQRIHFAQTEGASRVVDVLRGTLGSSSVIVFILLMN